MQQLQKAQTERTLNESALSSKILEGQQLSKFDKLKKQMLDNLNKVECSQNNSVKLVCSAGECLQINPFMCNDQSCKCVILHKQCCMVRTKYLHEDIVSKLIDTEQLIIKLDAIFDKIIDDISEKRINMIKELKYNFGLTRNQINYKMRAINNGSNEKYFYGSNILIIIKQKQIPIQERIKAMALKFKYSIDQFQQQVKYNCHKINMQIEKFCEKITPKYFNSNIADNKDQQEFLFKSIKEVVNIQRLQLLYRGTQNNFCTFTFQNKCHQKSNLLFLLKNQKGKKYGAYTPCTYKRYQCNNYQQDVSMKSFLFTLTDKMKFKILKKQFAMKNLNINRALISFGQDHKICMLIACQSNISKCNWFLPLDTYEHNSKLISTEYINEKNLLQSYSLLQLQVYQIHEQVPSKK